MTPPIQVGFVKNAIPTNFQSTILTSGNDMDYVIFYLKSRTPVNRVLSSEAYARQ